MQKLQEIWSEIKEDERQEIYIPPEKRQKSIADFRLFWDHIKMEYPKTTNLLDATFDNVPSFFTEKWVEIYDQSGSAEYRHKKSKQIRFNTSMLRSNLCDFSNAYIVVKGTITVNPNEANYNKKLVLKNNAPFTSCILKINNTLIDNPKDLDTVMPV